MRFNAREGFQYPACYGTPQAFLDALAGAMSFQDATKTPLFYNGALRASSTGFGPPKLPGTTGDTFYGDAVWWDPRKGGALYVDSNFTSSLRDVMPTKGYRKFHGRAYGDIVPFVWVANAVGTTGGGHPVNDSTKYYFPDDVACAYNNWERKVAYTTTGDNPTTYNVVQRPWVYCDGFNYSQHPTLVQQSSRIGKVPNLISRMIIGKGPASASGTVADERLPENVKGGLGSFGGSASATISQIDMIPNHRHRFIDKASNSSVPTSSNSNKAGYQLTDPTNVTAYATDTEPAVSETNKTWPNPNLVQPHQNMPPYFVVGFKMYVGYGD